MDRARYASCARRDLCFASDPDWPDLSFGANVSSTRFNLFFPTHHVSSLTRKIHHTQLYPPMSRLAPVTKPIFRAQLSSRQSNGHAYFVSQISKLVFEYAQNWSSSANTRTYLQNNLQKLARENPHVQVVIRQRNNRQPIVRGFYRALFLSFGPRPLL
jgi:hypothetical protein